MIRFELSIRATPVLDHHMRMSCEKQEAQLVSLG